MDSELKVQLMSKKDKRILTLNNNSGITAIPNLLIHYLRLIIQREVH
jgi:hypothetical protein